MKKSFRKISCGLVMVMGLSLLGGCGKSSSPSKLIDKYASMCVLGDYKGVTYDATKTVVDDDMVQSKVDEFMTKYATTNNITTGTTKVGDTVNIDFVGTIDGEEFDGGSYEGYDVEIGSGRLLFDDELAGRTVGESFDVDTTFPEDYGVDTLNGKTAVFNITINYIEETILPDYSDAFVASNTDASSIEEYEQQVRDELSAQYLDSDEKQNKSAITNAVIDNAVITEYPEQEMEKLVDSTVSSVQSEASSMGYDLDTYISARYGIRTENDFRNYVSGIVEDYLKEKIVICAIAKVEGITASKKEISDYKKQMLETTGITDEAEFDKRYNNDDVTYYTIADKVVDFLLENGVASPSDAE